MQNDVPGIVQRTFQFALRIVKLCSTLIEMSGVSRTIGYQLVKSGTSVGALVEEAQSAPDRETFASRMNQALREARLTNYWLRLLVESKIIQEDRLQPLVQESDEIMKILGAITSTTYRSLS